VAVGAADLIAEALRWQGMADAEARGRCWFFDSAGLIVQGRPGLTTQQQPYAHAQPAVTDLVAAVRALRPTALIGLSGQAGLFSETVLAAMADSNARPIVFAMSNPTSQAECTAEQAYRVTHGRVVFASGSPFAAVEWGGQRHPVAQANNAYVFPGLGLGIVVCHIRQVTDAMFLAAADALAAATTPVELEQGAVYPTISRLREVSVQVAEAVARTGYHKGLAAAPEPTRLREYIRSALYEPTYLADGGRYR
jgi:malate dehydrogenase (oxaloacetate-decarboxylating)(NADP+)